MLIYVVSTTPDGKWKTSNYRPLEITRSGYIVESDLEGLVVFRQ